MGPGLLQDKKGESAAGEWSNVCLKKIIISSVVITIKTITGNSVESFGMITLGMWFLKEMLIV